MLKAARDSWITLAYMIHIALRAWCSPATCCRQWCGDHNCGKPLKTTLGSSIPSNTCSLSWHLVLAVLPSCWGGTAKTSFLCHNSHYGHNAVFVLLPFVHELERREKKRTKCQKWHDYFLLAGMSLLKGTVSPILGTLCTFSSMVSFASSSVCRALVRLLHCITVYNNHHHPYIGSTTVLPDFILTHYARSMIIIMRYVWNWNGGARKEFGLLGFGIYDQFLRTNSEDVEC